MVVTRIDDHREAGISTATLLVAPMVLCVANDCDHPEGFLLMRLSGGPGHALPCETTWKSGLGIVAARNADAAVRLVRMYAISAGTGGGPLQPLPGR